MSAAPGRPAVTVLVTDMDNTLFDWLEMWQAAFGAMLERLTADSGVPRETLEQEFFAIHQRHGTTEYAFAIQELPSLRARHPPEELPTRYAAAIEAYRTMRRRTLALYPGVLDTLRTIRAAGTLVVAYTESRAYYADYRVRALGLDGALDYLYSLPDHALYLKGECLRALDQYTAAIDPLTRAAQNAPSNTHAWLALGWCHKRTGRIDLAIESLEEALLAQPDDALVHYNLACYWSLAKNKRQALAYLSRALDLKDEYRQLVMSESDFDAIRSDPAFQALVRVTV